MVITTIIGYLLIFIGIIFLFLGSLGILRMPDVYNRLQAGTKATTLGALSTIVGTGLVEPTWFWKTLIIAVFIVLTNPIGSHTIARASYRSGIRPEITSDLDEYEDKCDCVYDDQETVKYPAKRGDQIDISL